MTTPESDSLAPFSAMLRAALGDLLAPGATTFVEMMAHDCLMEFPFALPGGVRRLEGRAALAQYIGGLGDIINIERMTLATAHQTMRPGVVILEFEGSGSGVQTGKPYTQNYISVITLRGGHIVHYRDYWNPLVAIEATGGDRAITAALQGEAN